MDVARSAKLKLKVYRSNSSHYGEELRKKVAVLAQQELRLGPLLPDQRSLCSAEGKIIMKTG
ncbi:uncharacterized protein Bfra_006528 [Botrytis fragariae]|uniref:Uncharacterized protein n=1 Tax=Botrytis fragariae TaxID=1964551 RepID=A0A8H6B591_9HELO|nr:uncharacterized protein Bfra_006528 [Botrytis fragariae]KAF5879320.1 hypothetical protein Bfra_006528 [Botrytis fragariae]